MQIEELDLSSAIEGNIENIKTTIDELNGALEIATKIKKENASFQKIDVDFYWDLINKKQRCGFKFLNIDNDYLMFELDLFDGMMKRVFFHDFKKSRKKHGVKIAILILITPFIVRGLSKRFLWHGSFWEGAFYPLILFTIGSIIMLPLYILSKRNPKIAGVIAMIIAFSGIAFLGLLVVLIIVSLLNKWLHFLY